MAFARNLVRFSSLGSINAFSRLSNSCISNNVLLIIPVRKKHYNPKFKWLRSKKIIPVTLPNTEKKRQEDKYFIESLGIYPRYWKHRVLTITSAGQIFDPYEPPDGDGKVSKLSNKGVVEKVKTSSKSFLSDKTALRKIKNYDPKFKVDLFLQEAQDIYIKAHSVLMKLDPEELSKYVTEKAIQEMMEGLKYKTVRWKFLESLEPPKLVQSRVGEIFIPKNLFAQLTVRFYSKQVLALYDRFGRLMYGSEILAKDVLEYVIFEKHINNEYGVWKLHGKIIPEWREPVASYNRTYRIEKEVEEEDEDEGFSPEDYPVHKEESEHKETAEIVKADSKASN